MTAQTEFILDFVQNLGRPHQIVARVIMPHHVLPQLVDALQRNIDLYRNRWGDLPGAASAATANPQNSPQNAGQPATNEAQQGVAAGGSSGQGIGGQGPAGQGAGGAGASSQGGQSQDANVPPKPGTGTRTASAQEVYDDLKIKDEFLSGSYANAVMIGHGAHEFSFDFITNFYPHSAVSARVFLAAGQVPRLYESLKGTWEQMQSRRQPPQGDQNTPTSSADPGTTNESETPPHSEDENPPSDDFGDSTRDS